MQKSIVYAIRLFFTENDESKAPQKNDVPVGKSTRCQFCSRREDREPTIKYFACGQTICNTHRGEVKTFLSFDYQDVIELKFPKIQITE